MQVRLTASACRFRQMLPWFKRGSGIILEQKHALWQTSLFPNAVYGIDALGVNMSTLTTLNKQMMQQLRTLGADHSFLSHISHPTFLQTRGLEPPAAPHPLPGSMLGGKIRSLAPTSCISHVRNTSIMLPNALTVGGRSIWLMICRCGSRLS